MAVAPTPGYSPQLSPGQSAPYAGASPEAFGAGIGQAEEQLGSTLHEKDLQIRRQKLEQGRQNDLADVTVQIERFSADQDAAAVAARDHAQPGAAGYTAALLQDHDSGAEQIVGDITDPVVRQHAMVMLAERRAQTQEQGEHYEATARGTKRANDVDELRNVAVGRLSAPGLSDADRLTVLGQVRDAGHSLLDHLTAPPEVITELRQQFDGSTADGFIRALQPQSARAALDSGRFDADLTPEARKSLNSEIDAGIRRQEALARTAAEAQASVGRASSRNLIEQVDRGVQVDQTQLDAALAEARAGAARGGPGAAEYVSLQQDLARASVGNAATRQYDPLSQDDRRTAMAAIEADPHWREQPDQVERHTVLTRLIERDNGAIAGGRLERWSRNTNQPLAAFELGNAQASAGRIAQAQSVAGYDHGPPILLTDAEAEHYRQQWQTGTPGDKATMIGLMAAHGPAAARAIALQLAGPSRPEMATLLDLASMRDRNYGGAIIREALDGEAAPLDPRLFPTPQVQALIRQRFGAALAGRDGAQLAGITKVANAIYAHRARLDNLGQFDPERYAASYEAAMGRAGNTGGVAQAPNGASFTLPRGLTSDDVFVPLQNLRPSVILRFSAGHAGPVWRDQSTGTAMVIGQHQLVSEYTPMLVYDDNRIAHYQFRSRSGGLVQRSDGHGPFTLDLLALHRLYAHAQGHH